MFFKRASKLASPKPTLESVQTIPEIFYGGNDPEADVRVGNKTIVKPNSVTSGSGSGAGTVSATHTRLIAVLMISIFVVVSAGAAWGYWKYLGGGSGSVSVETNQTTTQVEGIENSSENGVVEMPTSTTDLATSTPAVVTTTISNIVPTSSPFSLSELAADFPVINQLSAPDFDSDTLSDLEEDVFGTDQSVFDSDGDGYSDGQEVVNLYNPKGVTPVRLVDSGLVREFTHPRDVYRLYYPLVWQAGSVDAGSNTMLFTAANGDYIEVRLFNKNNGEDFSNWFGKNAKDQQITDLQTISNSFKTQYFKRKDGLVYYVDLREQVLVVLYHPLVNSPINYRTILQLFMESLRVSP